MRLKKKAEGSLFVPRHGDRLVSCISNWHQGPFPSKKKKKTPISKQYREKINYFIPHIFPYVAQRRTQNHRQSEKKKYLNLLKTVRAVGRSLYRTKNFFIQRISFELEYQSVQRPECELDDRGAILDTEVWEGRIFLEAAIFRPPALWIGPAVFTDVLWLR